jgi:hypothetical protein
MLNLFSHVLVTASAPCFKPGEEIMNGKNTLKRTLFVYLVGMAAVLAAPMSSHAAAIQEGGI